MHNLRATERPKTDGVVISGLRGAIAFALSLHLEFENEQRHVIVTTTLIIVLFTIVVLGGSTMPLMKVLLLHLRIYGYSFIVLCKYVRCMISVDNFSYLFG